MSCGTPIIASDYMLRGLLDVDDSNFGAGKMLVVNSNCDHEYVDPTALFESLQPSTFIGLTDTPADYVGYGSWIVRVNSAGTALEFVDPTTMGLNTDRYVASEYGATPGFLGDVLDVVNGELTLTVSGDRVILGLDSSVLSSISTNFLALTDTESSYSGQAGKVPVVNESENGLEFQDIGNKKLRARRYMNSDFSVTQAINVADSTFVVNNMNGFEGDGSMNGSYSGTPSIIIPKKGLYRVTLGGNMGFSKGVLAGRIMAASTPPSAYAPICDAKFGSRDSNNGHGAYPNDMVVTYGQSMIYEFEAGTHIYTGGIISTTVGSIGGGITHGTIDILHGNVRGSGSDDRGHTLEVSRFSSKY